MNLKLSEHCQLKLQSLRKLSRSEPSDERSELVSCNDLAWDGDDFARQWAQAYVDKPLNNTKQPLLSVDAILQKGNTVYLVEFKNRGIGVYEKNSFHFDEDMKLTLYKKILHTLFMLAHQQHPLVGVNQAPCRHVQVWIVTQQQSNHLRNDISLRARGEVKVFRDLEQVLCRCVSVIDAHTFEANIRKIAPTCQYIE